MAVCTAAVATFTAFGAVDTGQDRFFRYLMGTAVRIEVYGGTSAARREAADEGFAAIAEVDRLMSDYRQDSEITVLNQTASARAVRVSEPLMAVLAAAERVSRESHGAFDATIRPALVLWGVKDGRAHSPSPLELANIRPAVGY